MSLDVFQVEVLANELNEYLKGKKVLELFSVSSSEYFILLENTNLRLNFFKGELFIQEVEERYLPKKNRLFLFKALEQQTILKVIHFPMDRVMQFEFEGELDLVFYFFGKFGQTSLYQKGEYLEHFPLRSKLIEQAPNIKAELDISALNDLKAHMPWLVESVAETFDPEKDFQEQWEVFTKQKKTGPWCIERYKGTYKFGNRCQDAVAQFDRFFDAYSDFSRLYISSSIFEQSKKEILASMQKEIDQLEKKVSSTKVRVKRSKEGVSFKEKGDLLMAYMHLVKSNVKEIELPSFTTSEPVKIKLNTELSPSKNAERYYRKSKNEGKELKILEAQLAQNEELLSKLRQKKEEVEAIEKYRELKSFLPQEGKSASKRLPYIQRNIDGYEIRIGRSAKDNDELLRAYSSPHDLWFHAKGVAGSHVILRRRSKNEQLNKSLIEKVASLAAYYSKAKHEELARVIYCEKKYVRKPKGSGPGQVIVEQETSLLVEPLNT